METHPRSTVDNDPKAGEWELTLRPPTPWGARYGVYNQGPGPFQHTNRSWLSPSFPTFDPSDIHNILQYIPQGVDGAVEAPKGEEADRLFTSEAIQLQRFGGLRTWEAVLLKDVSSYEAGNELVLPGNEESQKLVVKEDDWFLPFKKNRWIDYNVRLRDSGIDCPRTYGGDDGIWSVDNPAVWEELGPPLELANRILRLACHGPWLPSLVDPSAHETSLGIRYILNKDSGDVSAPTDSEPYRKFVEVDPHRRLSPKCVTQFINTLAYHFSWSFFDPRHEFPTPEPFRGQTMCVVDCPALRQGGSSQMVISIDISAIKALFSWNVTDVERSIIQHTIGVNIALAFVDALARNRGLAYLEHEAKYDPRSARLRQFQLFYNEEVIADHRASFAKSLFGGKLEFPLYQGPGSPNKTGFVLPITAREFPTQAEALQQLAAVGEITGPLTLKLYPAWLHRHLVWPIPCIWQASMMNESFWKYDVVRFDLQALKFPKYLFCEDLFHLGWSMSAFRTTPAGWVMDKVLCPENGPGHHLIKQLQQRRRLWSRFREKWYEDMHRCWELPPYSNIIFREELRLITDEYFLRRQDYDEFRAHEIAEKWIIMPYFIASEAVVPPLFYTNALLCRAVGLLVMAALPARLETKTCQRSGSIRPDERRQLWKLSKEAIASSGDNPIRVMEHWWADRKAPDFVLPKRHAGQTAAEILAMRVEFLNEARNTLELYRSQDMALPLLTRALLLQIRHLRHLLRDVMPRHIIQSSNRNAGATKQGEGAGRWLDLFFKIPKYSHENQIRDPGAIEERPTTKSIVMDKSYFEKIGIHQEPVSVPAIPTVEEVPNPEMQLWTVGQVADQFRNGRFWALVQEGARYAVHDVTDAISGFSFPWSSNNSLFSYCRYGRVMKDNIESTFSPRKAQKIRRKGYLVQEFSAEEVAEARTTIRSWTRIGDDVYDITEVLSPTSNVILLDNEREVLLESKGRNAIVALQNHGLETELERLRQRFKRCKIGRVRRRTPSAEDGPVYCADDMCWFTSQRTGMYTVVRGVVYDLTDFIDWHPGGSSILTEYAVGKDCTELFNRAHTEPDKVLNTIKHLIVSKTVPRRENTILEHDEFVIDEHIYKLNVGEEEMIDIRLPHHHLYNEIAWMDRDRMRINLSEAHKDTMALARHSELIVGKLKPVLRPPDVNDEGDAREYFVEPMVLTSWLPGVRDSDLAKCNGRHSALGYNEGWICVDSVIYNITTLIRYGHPPLQAAFAGLCGKVTVRENLPQQFLPYLEDRAIAKLDENAPQWNRGNNFTFHANEGTRHTPKITRFAPRPTEKPRPRSTPTPKPPRPGAKRKQRQTRARSRSSSPSSASTLSDSPLSRRAQEASKGEKPPPPALIKRYERFIESIMGRYSYIDTADGTVGLSNKPLDEITERLHSILKYEIRVLEKLHPSSGARWKWKCNNLLSRLINAWEEDDERSRGIVDDDPPLGAPDTDPVVSQGLTMMAQGDPETPPPETKPPKAPSPEREPSETSSADTTPTRRRKMNRRAMRLLHRAQVFKRTIYDRDLETQNVLLKTLENQKLKRRRRPKIPEVKAKRPPHKKPFLYGRRPMGPRPGEEWSPEEIENDLPPRLPDVWPYATYSMFMPSTWNDEHVKMAKKLAQERFQCLEDDELEGMQTTGLGPDPEELAQMTSQVLPIMEFFGVGEVQNNWGDGYSSGEDEGILALKSVARARWQAMRRLLLSHVIEGKKDPPLGDEDKQGK